MIFTNHTILSYPVSSSPQLTVTMYSDFHLLRPPRHSWLHLVSLSLFLSLFKDSIHFFERQTARERVQAEGGGRGRSRNRLPTKQGVWCGATVLWFDSLQILSYVCWGQTSLAVENHWLKQWQETFTAITDSEWFSCPTILLTSI